MRIVPQKFMANDGREFETEMEALLHDHFLLMKGMEQWKFSFLYRRDLKPEYLPTYKTCGSCHGNKVVGGGFGDPDGERDCPECSGRGEVVDTRPEFVEAPPIPESLREAMMKTWDEWWTAYHANPDSKFNPPR